jgi:PTH1 family peptidyl-tRNA hydrolase
MRLVVGLGNPGSRYARNRHNVGFMAVDAIARRHGSPGFRSRFKGELAEGPIGGERVLLLKPQTFMNLSGESVGEAARFFKILPSEIIVIHDEIDLRPGKLRVKLGGGSAGHNGLRSIDGLLGPDYWRVRIGVGHPGIRNSFSPTSCRIFPAKR